MKSKFLWLLFVILAIAIGLYPYNLFEGTRDSEMSQFGRITTLDDLPEDEILIQYIQNGVLLNETGVKLPAKKKNRSCRGRGSGVFH